ncbi:hypothetical protein LguiA_033785 [Lonicera macranthoides]
MDLVWGLELMLGGGISPWGERFHGLRDFAVECGGKQYCVQRTMTWYNGLSDNGLDNKINGLDTSMALL